LVIKKYYLSFKITQPANLLRRPSYFFFTIIFGLMGYNCGVSAQTRIKSSIVDGDAVILTDTLNEFNRYPPIQSSRQYIPSFADLQEIDKVLQAVAIVPYRILKLQYSGYINLAGDTVLVACFLDFSHGNKARRYFANWEYQNEYLASVLFLDKPAPGILCYSYNRQTKKVYRYWVP
jgi:hypothetical protein